MAAIDKARISRYQWLPRNLFPLQNHPIATPTRTYNRQEIAFMDRKIYIQ